MVTKAFQQVNGMKPLRASTTRPKHRIASNQKALPQSTSRQPQSRRGGKHRDFLEQQFRKWRGNRCCCFFLFGRALTVRSWVTSNIFVGWGDEKTKVWTGKTGFCKWHATAIIFKKTHEGDL